MKYHYTDQEYREFAAIWNHHQQHESKPATAGAIKYPAPVLSEQALININQAALRREFSLLRDNAQ